MVFSFLQEDLSLTQYKVRGNFGKYNYQFWNLSVKPSAVMYYECANFCWNKYSQH